MSKIRKRIIIIFIFLSLVVLLLSVDDSLSPLSHELMEYKVTEQLENNGEVYLWCFDCKTDDTYSYAKRMLKQVKHLAKGDYKDEINWKDMVFYQLDDSTVLCPRKMNSDGQI